jgi:hypothetical protein
MFLVLSRVLREDQDIVQVYDNYNIKEVNEYRVNIGLEYSKSIKEPKK